MSAPTTLLEQQRALQAAICDGANADTDGLLSAPRAGLSIYRHAHGARLLAALRDNYETLHLALGDAAFDALGLAYLAAHPPHRPSIRWFGDQLPAFMDSAQGQVLRGHAALVDLARMDWALRHAFDAAAAPPLQAADLAALSPEQWAGLPLRPQPSAGLLALDWAVEPLWRALQHDAEAELEAPEALGHHLLVWRQGLETRWRSLEAAEAGAVAALLGAGPAGLSFAALCELLAEAAGAEAAPALALQLLGQWLADALLQRPG